MSDRAKKWTPWLLLGAIAAMLVAARFLDLGTRLGELRDWIDSLGSLGPVVFVLASIAGVLFLHEAVTGRLSLSTAMILGGVALAIATHKGRSSRTNLDGSPGPP